MCHWECIAFSPVSGDGGEAENKWFLFYKRLFFFCCRQCLCSHGEAHRVKETGESCRVGLSTYVSYLGRMNKECRMPAEALAPCEIPLLSAIESHPDIASFMHSRLLVPPCLFNLCQNDNGRLICQMIDMNHFISCFWTVGSWLVPKKKRQPGTRVAQ